MKHFKFETEVKVIGRRQKVKGVASTKKQRVTAAQAGKLRESIINSIKFKTTVEALPIDFIIDLDIPMLKPEVSPEGAAAPSGE